MKTNKQLKQLNDIYKNFIIQKYGKEALDHLDMEYAVLTTNKVLETRTTKEFERMRREYYE